ncbi:MAG TPA: hypothetical protein VMX55_03245 [candidate division Zixibacteria bacterium]|nr:hypothetical protein [candidate division Zixibacteria bacterium]
MKALLDILCKGLKRKDFTVESCELVENPFMIQGIVAFKKGLNYYSIVFFESLSNYPDSYVLDKTDQEVEELFETIKEITTSSNYSLLKYGLTKDSSMFQRVKKEDKIFDIAFFLDKEDDLLDFV